MRKAEGPGGARGRARHQILGRRGRQLVGKNWYAWKMIPIGRRVSKYDRRVGIGGRGKLKGRGEIGGREIATQWGYSSKKEKASQAGLKRDI